MESNMLCGAGELMGTSTILLHSVVLRRMNTVANKKDMSPSHWLVGCSQP